MKTKPKNKQLELDELPDIHREILEIARNDKTRPTFAPEVERTWIAQERDRAWIAQEVERLWIAKLVLRGVSAENALKLLEGMPALNAVKRLLKANDETVRELHAAEAGEGDRP